MLHCFIKVRFQKDFPWYWIVWLWNTTLKGSCCLFPAHPCDGQQGLQALSSSPKAASYKIYFLLTTLSIVKERNAFYRKTNVFSEAGNHYNTAIFYLKYRTLYRTISINTWWSQVSLKESWDFYCRLGFYLWMSSFVSLVLFHLYCFFIVVNFARNTWKFIRNFFLFF